ncbi:MAG: septum formation inhibitor Maf [Woeseiaceae bacterium]|nr:septum formation inhibitor Maf [Woeseiaceae bacterium]
MPQLHLASQSARRQQILAALGLTFTAAGVDADERRIEGESPEAMVLRLAEVKAAAAGADDSTVVIGADTAVVLGDRVFGKPSGEADCLAMLEALSGQTHRVLTGVAVRSGGRIEAAMSATDVTFREISPDEALLYWQSGEPRDKAGAYAIQGKGGVFVAAISGSYSGVVGLPVYETVQLLYRAGIEVLINE